MEFISIANAVAKYAPLLASVISASNPIAGLIVMAIAKEFNSSTDPSLLISAINRDPSAAEKLKQLEFEHEDAIYQNQVEDRISARQREEEIVQITGKRDWVIDCIALVVIFGFFSLCVLNYFIQLEDDHIIVMLIGQISSGFMMVLSYFFGSSNK